MSLLMMNRNQVRDAAEEIALISSFSSNEIKLKLDNIKQLSTRNINNKSVVKDSEVIVMKLWMIILSLQRISNKRKGLKAKKTPLNLKRKIRKKTILKRHETEYQSIWYFSNRQRKLVSSF